MVGCTASQLTSTSLVSMFDRDRALTAAEAFSRADETSVGSIKDRLRIYFFFFKKKVKSERKRSSKKKTC